MTRKEMLIISLLLEYGHRDRHTGANIKQVIKYSEMFAELQNDSDLCLSEIGFRRALPNLLHSGYICEGDRDGLKKTYYLSDLGKTEIIKLSKFKDDYKEKLDSVQKELERVRAKRKAEGVQST